MEPQNVSTRKEIYPVDKSVIDADNDQGDNSITILGKISGMENSFES